MSARPFSTERAKRRWWVRWCYLWKAIGDSKQWDETMYKLGWISFSSPFDIRKAPKPEWLS